MAAALADELFRVFRRVGPRVLGRKKSRRLMLSMLTELLAETPANGCGPVVQARRDACLFLESGLATMDGDRG